MAAPSTPRRSTRGQLVAIATPRRSSGSEYAWTSTTPSSSQSIDPVNDLDETERAALDKVDPEDRSVLHTRFYDEIERKSVVAHRRKKGKSSRPESSYEVSRYHVGDTVLVPTILAPKGQPSIGVITAMYETDLGEEEEEDSAHSRFKIRVHYFCRQSQLPSIRAKRPEPPLPNEIYYSLSGYAIIHPDAIEKACSVRALPSKEEGESDDEDEGPTFLCRYAVNARQGLFYDFEWSKHRNTALSVRDTRPEAWDVIPAPDSPNGKNKKEKRVTERKAEPRTPTRRRKVVDKQEKEGSDQDSASSGEDYAVAESDSDEDTEEDIGEDASDSDSDLENVDDEVGASRKRKRPVVPTTPRKRSRTVAHATPHSKRAQAKRKIQGSPRKKRKLKLQTPATYTAEELKNLPDDPWLRAMHLLHVGNRPGAAGALKGREPEYERILREVSELIEAGQGGCVYISGVPGTGKTATVHAVVRELKRMAESSETLPFTYVEINGLRIPDPASSYTLLWEALSGQSSNTRMSSKESLKALTKYFGASNRGPAGHPCVVLMDELDQLLTGNKQDVVYNFFNWPSLVGSTLIVIAVANTMDLPERVMEGRVRSRLGMVRINFQPYNTAQLESIVHARLNAAQQDHDILEQKSVLHPDGVKMAAMRVGGISGDARRVLDICRRAVERAAPGRKEAKAAQVMEVIKVMQNSPTAAYLRDCSFHEKVMLASVIKVIKREGVDEVKWGEVEHQHIMYIPVLTTSDTSKRPTRYETLSVLESLVASKALLVEEGVAVSRKGDDERRVLLNLELGEVERVLSEVGDRWKNLF